MYSLDWLGRWTDKFTSLRPHQETAIKDILGALEETPIVVVEAPTGSGKTLIAEVVRHELNVRGLFLCNTIQLQQQFLDDFPYSTVLKGRRNYRPELVDVRSDVTCEDCNGTPPFKTNCTWCSSRRECPYEQAKAECYKSKVGVLNTAYFLAEANGVRNGVGRSRPFVVVDEADTLEGSLLGYVEFRITDSVCRDFRVAAPKKGSHKSTIVEWLDELREQVAHWIDTHEEPIGSEDLVLVRRYKRNVSLHDNIVDVLAGDLEENWVRDNDAGPLVLKPIHVRDKADRVLWQHSRTAMVDEDGMPDEDEPGRWLLMSGTIGSPEMYMATLGKEGHEYSFVKVESTFPVENRPIYLTNSADMTRNGGEDGTNGGWWKAAAAINRILSDHPDERVLIHSVSYKLTRFLCSHVSKHWGTRIITHDDGKTRMLALERYIESSNGVLISPSMDRGVDLSGDLCRVLVICKLPFPYLGDPQVNARMHSREPGLGQMWYEMETGRTLVQMTGRGVRSAEDTCTTYVLDSTAPSFIKKTYTTPTWWREGVSRTFNARKWRERV